MSFRPDVANRAEQTSGSVDYRMARHALVAEFRRGRLTRQEVCDAHPELRRAAEHLGRPTRLVCPICEDAHLVLVTYAFGPRLPRSGYAVEDRADLEALRSRTSQFTCYVIEVCGGCGWNHLVQTFPVDGYRNG